jgi:hypothetical protein
MNPAGGIGEILANPEEQNGGDDGKLAGYDKEGMSPLSALVESLDLVGGKIALFGGKKGIGHQSLSPAEVGGLAAAGSSLFRFNHMRVGQFH